MWCRVPTATFTWPPKKGLEATPLTAWCSASSRLISSLLVKGRRDFALDSRRVIVLNPQLRVVLLHEFLDHRPALRSLFLIGVERGDFFVGDLFGVVIQIP